MLLLIQLKFKYGRKLETEYTEKLNLKNELLELSKKVKYNFYQQFKYH